MSIELSSFFSLDNFLYNDLWGEDLPIWHPLIHLEKFFFEQNLGVIQADIPRGAYLENISQISIGNGTVIESGAFIRGPCIIGENCIIRNGAYIRGHVLTGNDCVIGHATEIKHSILLDRAHAAHFAYIGNSILGNDVNLGAGVKCANFRLDKKEIEISFQGQALRTGLMKFGSIIGDGSQVGCNSVLNPGTLIGSNVISYPSVNLKGVISPFSIVRNSCSTIIRGRKGGKSK